MFCCSMSNWGNLQVGDLMMVGLERREKQKSVGPLKTYSPGHNYNTYKFVVFKQNVCISDVQIYIITATSYSQN